MFEISTTQIVLTAAAVILFVLFLIFLLVIVDHKARIPGGEVGGPVKVVGKRRNHPIWSYLIGGFLLTVIAAVAFELAAAMRYKIPGQEPPAASTLLEKLEKQRTEESARHFHNPATGRTLEGKKSVCFYCHGDFPHFEVRMIRTLLNMHTQFIGCMTCHADPDQVDEDKLTLRWLNTSGIEVQGPPFGTDFNPETGFLIQTDDYFSRIVPFLSENGSENSLEVTEDDPVAQEFIRVQEQLRGPDKAAVKKSFHRLVAAKGRFCTRCHTEPDKSFIPFEELGFSQRRIGELTSLNIIGLVQKYKRFYMPNLSGRETSAGETDPIVRPEVSLPPSFMESASDDPRSWWRKGTDAPMED